jgi:hypothetical protein
MKLILLYILLCVIYSQDNTDKYVKQFSYSYLSTIFLEKYTKNIVVFKGKTNITKCYATGNIKINDTIFEYENSEIISNIDISFPNQEKIESIIKENVKDIYLQNKFILSFFIFYIVTNPYKEIEINNKLRLFILNLPFEEINPIELLVDKNEIGEYLINDEWLDYQNNVEIELLDNIIKNCLDIDINNKTNEEYILFGKIYYYVKSNSINIDGNAVIFPFMDSCNIVPYYLYKDNLNYDSISIEKDKNKIIIKSKIDILLSEQFIYSFDYPLTNDYLLLKQGKVVFNNINDNYKIKKNLTFEDHIIFLKILKKTKKGDISNALYNRLLKKRFAVVTFELNPNKINDYIYIFTDIYYNNIIKSFIMIIRMCYDEVKEISRILRYKYKSRSFENYLLKIQKIEENSDIKSEIMKFNLAKINVLEKNVNLAFEKIVKYNINEIANLKINYI